MYTKNMLAVSGALISAVAAVPMAKRDLVWVTETSEVIVTMPLTTTVWVNPSAAPTTFAHHQHGHPHSSKAQTTSTVTSTIVASSSSVEESSSYVAPSSSSSPAYVAPTTSSSSSVYVAPTTSSSVYVAPTTSSVYVAPTTSSTTEAPASTVAPTTYAAPATTSSAPAASGSGLTSGMGAAGSTFTGDLTWYDTGLGACGITSGQDDAIVAISEVMFDSYNDNGNPNNNPLCGQTVTITGVDGSPYTATIVDRCTGCKEADLDLSNGFFNKVTNNGDGRVHNMKWVMN